MKKIDIHTEILEEMHRHALADFPNECVGFFFGETKEDHKTVSEYVPLENSKEGDQRRRFEVAPLDYIKAEKHALEQGIDLLGIYHSHPLHPAIPSEHDLKQAVPTFSYVIASVTDAKIENTTSWQLDEENNFEEELIKN
jgi:proteasome lid subunit RPN8/RPN11